MQQSPDQDINFFTAIPAAEEQIDTRITETKASGVSVARVLTYCEHALALQQLPRAFANSVHITPT